LNEQAAEPLRSTPPMIRMAEQPEYIRKKEAATYISHRSRIRWWKINNRAYFGLRAVK
jgi:hypothetical protein